jgi:nucleotide-binding universal stress UspA family protein
MYQRILVPVDGSPTSARGVDEAIQLAKLTKGRLLLVHLVEPLPYALAGEGYGAMTADIVGMMTEAGRKVLNEAQQRVEKEGVAVEAKLVETLDARLSDCIAEHVDAWRADLVVVGTHGRRGVQRVLLGSDAELIVRTAKVPVLLVRGDTPGAAR